MRQEFWGDGELSDSDIDGRNERLSMGEGPVRTHVNCEEREMGAVGPDWDAGDGIGETSHS
jgi:hypothetical protein